MVPEILLLDSDGQTVAACTRELVALGYHPIVATDEENACALLNSEHPVLLLAGVSSPAESSVELLRAAHGAEPEVPVIVLTYMATVEAAAQMLRQGALFYLLKPIVTDELKLAVERGTRHPTPPLAQHGIEPQPHNTSSEIIVGASAAVREVLDLATRVAHSDANIVLFGESGTGKELFARTLHACSRRAHGAFVPVDCASLPENLLEAELFGFEKGAFTGAIRAKPGLMELANNGTLFFDEIAELPLNLQPKLLRALQERNHRRLGGTNLVRFDVRVISATNRELGRLVMEEKFRQDLYYRLNVVPIHLPPLRNRENDAVLLANHLLAERRRKSLCQAERFAPEVLRLFEQYSWPGNVRELQNVVEYCCALAQTETVGVHDLPEELQLYNPRAVAIAPSSQLLNFKVAKAQWLAQFESTYVADLLKRYGDNISQAARAAGIDRKTFYSLLDKHHVRPSAAPERKASSAL